MRHGTEWDFAAIRKALDKEAWEADPDNPGYETRGIYLGSILNNSPSGKYYLPFACSNVAGDCPQCGGSGVVKPRVSKRVFARTKARLHRFAMRTIKRAHASAYIERVSGYRANGYRVINTTCEACGGMGSISAARDEAWREYTEKGLETIGAYLTGSEGDGCDMLAMESREKVEHYPSLLHPDHD